jgi:hypothetical protein
VNSLIESIKSKNRFAGSQNQKLVSFMYICYHSYPDSTLH